MHGRGEDRVDHDAQFGSFHRSINVVGSTSKPLASPRAWPGGVRADPADLVLCMLERARGRHAPILQPTRDLLSRLDRDPRLFTGYLSKAIEMNRAYFVESEPGSKLFGARAYGLHGGRAARLILEARLLASWLYADPAQFEIALKAIDLGAGELVVRARKHISESARQAME
jgi:hypothetical protein